MPRDLGVRQRNMNGYLRPALIRQNTASKKWFFCYVRCKIVRVGRMSWLEHRRNRLPCKFKTSRDKSHAIKELVVYWVIPKLIPWAIERVTLQFKRRVCWRRLWEDLYPERHLAPKRSGLIIWLPLSFIRAEICA